MPAGSLYNNYLSVYDVSALQLLKFYKYIASLYSCTSPRSAIYFLDPRSSCSPIVSASAAACSPITSTSAAAPRLRPLQLLLPDCVHFSCCSPIASTSAAAPQLHPFQLHPCMSIRRVRVTHTHTVKILLAIGTYIETKPIVCKIQFLHIIIHILQMCSNN